MSEHVVTGELVTIVSLPPTATVAAETELMTGLVAGAPDAVKRYGGL